VASGPPEEILSNPRSYTAQALRRVLLDRERPELSRDRQGAVSSKAAHEPLR
jgi:hypothetical protein